MRRRKPIAADYELSTTFDFDAYDKIAAKMQRTFNWYVIGFCLIATLFVNSIFALIYLLSNIGYSAITGPIFISTLLWTIFILTISFIPNILVATGAAWIFVRLFFNIITPAEFRRQSVWVEAYRKRLAAYRQDLADWNYLNLETGEGFWKSLRGAAFEDALARLFQRRGFSVEKTKTTGDGGIDLILRSGSDLIFVQCKGYAKPVPVAPIREIAGVCSRSQAGPVVAAVNGFTKGAIECARELNVTLVDTPGIVRMAALDHLDKSSLRAVSSAV